MDGSIDCARTSVADVLVDVVGSFTVSYYTSMATDVVVDITGYFNAAGL